MEEHHMKQTGEAKGAVKSGTTIFTVTKRGTTNNIIHAFYKEDNG